MAHPKYVYTVLFMVYFDVRALCQLQVAQDNGVMDSVIGRYSWCTAFSLFIYYYCELWKTPALTEFMQNSATSALIGCRGY